QTGTIGSGDAGKNLRVKVTASTLQSTTVISTTVPTASVHVVNGNVPVNTKMPVISGAPQVGQTLSASTGNWTSNPAYGQLAYNYNWQRCLSYSMLVKNGYAGTPAATGYWRLDEPGV